MQRGTRDSTRVSAFVSSGAGLVATVRSTSTGLQQHHRPCSSRARHPGYAVRRRHRFLLQIDDSHRHYPTASILTPFADRYVLRSWRPADRQAAAEVIRCCLQEFGLAWDADDADRDAVQVEEYCLQLGGEFYVIECTDAQQIVGTGAWHPREDWGGAAAAEIRKMYLLPEHRRRGLGCFLLRFLEARVFGTQPPRLLAIIESASALRDACLLYRRAGYLDTAADVRTARCDVALCKLRMVWQRQQQQQQQQKPARGRTSDVDEEQVPVLNAEAPAAEPLLFVPRSYAQRYRLLTRAVGVLVRLTVRSAPPLYLVHTRSAQRAWYGGRRDMFIGGLCTRTDDSTAEAARREVAEEIGVACRQCQRLETTAAIHIESERTRCHVEVFVCEVEPQFDDAIGSDMPPALQLNEAEVASAKWRTWSTIAHDAECHPERYVPEALLVWQHIAAHEPSVSKSGEAGAVTNSRHEGTASR
eukprot:ctg_511.g289